MPGIDSHQHFWKFDPVRDAWITEEMGAIRRDFLPEELTDPQRTPHRRMYRRPGGPIGRGERLPSPAGSGTRLDQRRRRLGRLPVAGHKR